jgi:excisionase family DNA binding protein
MTPPTVGASPWLTLKEGAAYARTGTRIVYQAIRAGQLRAVRVGGRRELRIKREWIDAFLETLEVTR